METQSKNAEILKNFTAKMRMSSKISYNPNYLFKKTLPLQSKLPR